MKTVLGKAHFWTSGLDLSIITRPENWAGAHSLQKLFKKSNLRYIWYKSNQSLALPAPHFHFHSYWACSEPMDQATTREPWKKREPRKRSKRHLGSMLGALKIKDLHVHCRK